MKTKINKIMMYASGIFFLTYIGCTELEETPLDFTGPDNYYNNSSQVESAFAASMSRIYTRWAVYGYGAHSGAFTGTDQLRGGDLAFSANQANDMWRGHYRAIADLNPAIGAMNKDDSPIAQAEKELLMAQARFLRGMNYFSLVRMYGDIPIMTEETDVVTDEIDRRPIAEVYSFIIEDLNFAIQRLPDTWGGDTPGRPTAGAAKAMLAKVYLTMATFPLSETSKYALARDMAADVMDDNVYSLITEVGEVFELNNQYGPEAIFSFNATSDDKSTPPQIWLPSHMADGWTDHGANRIWHLAYPEQPRKEAYLLMEDWDGVRYTDWPNGAGYNVKKFLYDDRETIEKLSSTQNIPILRYADVLLMFAEAENMASGGPTQAAVDAVNLIINRANGGVANPLHPLLTTGMSQNDFDAAVINERNYELCFEYDRWYDLIRKRILCDVVNDDVKVNCSDEDYLFPIPQADLRLNELMTQNPGYPVPGGE